MDNREFQYLEEIRKVLINNTPNKYRVYNLVSDDIDRSDYGSDYMITIAPGETVALQEQYAGGLNSTSPYVDEIQEEIVINISITLLSEEENEKVVSDINNVRYLIRTALFGLKLETETYPIQFVSSARPVLDEEDNVVYLMCENVFTIRRISQRNN